MCMIKTFRGGGVVDREGGSSERCLKWVGGGWGSLTDLSKTSQNRGGKRQKLFVRGRVLKREGFEGVTTPASPGKF